MIRERKLRKVGNSVVFTLSKEFLEATGLSESDTVLLDEKKLSEALVKKREKTEEGLEFEMMLAQSIQKHDEVYKRLVDR